MQLSVLPMVTPKIILPVCVGSVSSLPSRNSYIYRKAEELVFPIRTEAPRLSGVLHESLFLLHERLKAYRKHFAYGFMACCASKVRIRRGAGGRVIWCAFWDLAHPLRNPTRYEGLNVGDSRASSERVVAVLIAHPMTCSDF